MMEEHMRKLKFINATRAPHLFLRIIQNDKSFSIILAEVSFSIKRIPEEAVGLCRFDISKLDYSATRKLNESNLTCINQMHLHLHHSSATVRTNMQ